MDIPDIIEEIGNISGVIGVHPLDPRTLYRVIKEETSVEKWMGMPLFNEAAETCLSMKHTFCIFSKEFIEPCFDGFIVFTDFAGIEVGRFVSGVEKEFYMKNKNIIWMTDNIVIFPYRMIDGLVSVSVRAMEPTFLKNCDGISSASIYYPCKKTDDLLKRRYGIDPKCCYSSAILGLEFASAMETAVPSAEVADESS